MKSEQLPQTAETSEINQWDPGLRASMEFCLAAFRGRLECHCGYEINKRPNEADMVIVKKAGAGRLDDIVAEFFDEINVIEFKSPGDHMGVSELYKAKGYASMIVANGFQDRKVDPRHMTITLVREERPDAIISYLRALGLGYSHPYPGVYRFTGAGIFPIQILAYGEMDDDRWLVLRSMTRRMTPEMRAAVREVLVPFCTDEEREKLVEAIVHTYFKANKKLFEEGDSMYEWLEPVYKPKMDRIAAESMALGRSEGIALGEQKGILSTLIGLVRDGILGAGDAAKRAGLSLKAFNAKMAEYEASLQA